MSFLKYKTIYLIIIHQNLLNWIVGDMSSTLLMEKHADGCLELNF